jgi:succinate dehydrogenase/fumarate reductase flavoprotein subunit
MSALSHPDADFDVVVVGGGPAGLSAGLTAAISGAEVLIVTAGKSPRQRDTGAVLAFPLEGEAWVAVLDAKREDLVQISRALPLVKKWVNSLLERNTDLSLLGHPEVRGVEWLAGENVLASLKTFLQDELLSRPNARLKRDSLISEVHTLEDRVIGVSVVDDTGKKRKIRTPRVILCTGGIAGLFSEEDETASGTALCVVGAVGARLAKTGTLVGCKSLRPQGGGGPALMGERTLLAQDPRGFYGEIRAAVLIDASQRKNGTPENEAMVAGHIQAASVAIEIPFPLGYCGIVDVDATGETTIEGLYLCGLARGWGPFRGMIAGVPLLNALISGVISGQSAGTSPPDPALALLSDETNDELCADTLLPRGFTAEKRRRLTLTMQRAFLGIPSPLDKDSARRELLKLRGEARDFKRFRAIPELWRLYHSCEAALILLAIAI